MKSVICIFAALLLAPECFAVFTKTYTVCESGCDYTTLTVAENTHDQDLVANDSALTFEIQNTWTATHANVSFSGWNSDGTRFPTIIAVGAARASGTWDDNAFRIVTSFSSCITTQDQDITIDGIQMHQTQTSTSFGHSFSNNSTGRLIVQNCFMRGNTTGTNIRGILFNNPGLDNSIIRNNVISDGTQEGIFAANAADGGIKIDNNTIDNFDIGIRTNPDVGIARNNIVVNSTTNFSGDWYTVTLSEENWTDAASISYGACGSCGDGDQLNETSDPFVDRSSDNYHLVSGSTAIDAGKDLSADFTDDIDGDTRPQGSGFDKGADEVVSSKRLILRKI